MRSPHNVGPCFRTPLVIAKEKLEQDTQINLEMWPVAHTLDWIYIYFTNTAYCTWPATSIEAECYELYL
jgi:hypothetical protein